MASPLCIPNFYFFLAQRKRWHFRSSSIVQIWLFISMSIICSSGNQGRCWQGFFLTRPQYIHCLSLKFISIWNITDASWSSRLHHWIVNWITQVTTINFLHIPYYCELSRLGRLNCQRGTLKSSSRFDSDCKSPFYLPLQS